MLPVERLRERATLIRSLRSFFTERGFLEVDTPVRQPVLIPERYIEPLSSDGFFLQTSPEICMKRLLALGCFKIFQICPCFRKNEFGRRHLEEFTMLEWYHSGQDYFTLMDDCEELFRFIAREGLAEKERASQEKYFSGFELELPWDRLTVEDAFEQFAPCDAASAMRDNRFDEILVEYVEPQLGLVRPTFLIDYPIELGSLAKRSKDNPDIVERFELYLGGVELANGFTELTDEDEQRLRFSEEIQAIRGLWNKDTEMPDRFLKDLQQLQSAAGIALGVDRLFMLALGLEDIREAVSFCPEDFQ
ncbi:EF-P lysine aminoacylase EpmA [Desulforhopalus sp. 52FAK]